MSHHTFDKIVFVKHIISYSAQDIRCLVNFSHVSNTFRECVTEYSDHIIENFHDPKMEHINNRKAAYMKTLCQLTHKAGILWLSEKLYLFGQRYIFSSFPDDKKLCKKCLEKKQSCEDCYSNSNYKCIFCRCYHSRNYDCGSQIDYFLREVPLFPPEIYMKLKIFHPYFRTKLKQKKILENKINYYKNLLQNKKEECIIISKRVNRIYLAAKLAYNKTYVSSSWLEGTKKYAEMLEEKYAKEIDQLTNELNNKKDLYDKIIDEIKKEEEQKIKNLEEQKIKNLENYFQILMRNIVFQKQHQKKQFYNYTHNRTHHILMQPMKQHQKKITNNKVRHP